MQRSLFSAYLVAALLVGGLAQGAWAQNSAELPPGRASDAARAWIAAINASSSAADSSRIVDWLRKWDPKGDLAVRSGRQMAIARRSGGFTLDHVIRASNDAVEVVLRERSSGDRVQLIIELNPSGTADAFGLRPADSRPNGPGSSSSQTGPKPAMLPNESAIVDSARAFLDSLVAADAFSGIVSITRNGSPVFERAYGLADRDHKTPNTLETRFNLGSINKIFTATAIRQLAAAGRLSLDSTLARAWPEYPNQEVARQVTIRQLLNHRSGIMGDIFRPTGMDSPNAIRHNRQLIRALAAAPLAFAPGSREEYSNFGYVVLGGVIEYVSGEDYYDYIQHNIYAPVGMSHSGHFPKDSLPEGTALGYTRQGSGWVQNSATLPGRGSAAGGGYSTLDDLKKLMAVLRRGTLVGAPPAGIGIAGGAPGINATVDGDLPGGYDVIVLTNSDPPAAMRVSARIRAWLGARD